METKQIFMVSVLLALVMGTVGAASAYDGSLTMTNVSVSPSPVMAGSNVTIRFQLYNAFDSWLNGVTLQPSGQYPILNASPLGSRVLGTVSPGYNTSGYYSYSFFVPNTTNSGTYTITFTATYFVYAATGTVIATSLMPVSFYVQNRPTVRLVASTPQSAALYTGHNQTVSLQIQNVGYGTARNVTVAVSPGPGLNLLSPVTTFFISNLTRGTNVTEQMLVGAQSLNSTYLTANVSYYSSKFQRVYSSMQRIGLAVAPSAQFSVNSTGRGVGVGAADVPVSFRVTNTGSSAADQLQLTLETTYPITPVASTAYVDSLGAGQSVNVTFLVDVDTAGVPGRYPVALYEQWKQPNGAVNQQFTGSNNYFVPVVAAGLSASSIAVYAVVVIIAILGGSFIYKRRMAKRGEGHKARKAGGRQDK